MNKQLKALEEALKMGAKIGVSFHHLPSKQEATTIIEEFSKMLNLPYKERTEYFSTYDDSFESQIEVTTFYTPAKEDKIRELEQQLASLKEETA